MAHTSVRNERRRWQRLPLPVPIFVRGKDEQGKEFLEFTTALNVSAGGALLATRRYLAKSSKVALEIPSAPLPQPAPINQSGRTLRAKVVQVTNSDRYHLCGLEFTKPLHIN